MTASSPNLPTLQTCKSYPRESFLRACEEPISLPRSHVEFKFVRLSERGHVEWESGDNRVLELPKTSVKGKAMHLRSKFNGSCV
eukprot:5193973-Amphidinium_carterae.1